MKNNKNESNKENNEVKEKKEKLKLMLIVFSMAFVLMLSLALQINTVKKSEKIAVTPKENKLRDILLKNKEQYSKLLEKEKDKQERLNKLREEATKNDNNAKSEMEKLEKVNQNLGLTDVHGPGVIITLEDGASKKDNTRADNMQVIVHDTDILQIVNLLKNAGAEAISVNDQRIVSKTAINCIGVVIKINDEKVSSPFIIKAIGNRDNLEGTMNMAGGIGDILKKYGIKLKVERKDNIEIKKYNGVYSVKYKEGVR